MVIDLLMYIKWARRDTQWEYNGCRTLDRYGMTESTILIF